jgi:hypothetical protein
MPSIMVMANHDHRYRRYNHRPGSVVVPVVITPTATAWNNASRGGEESDNARQ